MKTLEEKFESELARHWPDDTTPAGFCKCGWEYDGLGTNLRSHIAGRLVLEIPEEWG
jgi:hypothetical protein